MDKIVWNENYSVGVEEMDSQHKMLIEMINDLIDLAEREAEPSEVSYMIIRMANYSLHHLSREEELMSAANYADFDEHLKLHNEYRLNIENLCSAENFGITPTAPALLEYLASWLTNHILVEDKKYTECLNPPG